MSRSLLLLALVASAAAPPRAEAHDGPPYLIIVDRQTRHGRLSLWGDPDLGTGTFWVYLEPTADTPLADDVTVRMTAQRAGRQAPVARSGEAQPVRRTAEEQRFQGEIPFDELGPWLLRIELTGARGSEAVEEVVEVTPPGQGPVLDFILYLFPFVAVGLLFILAMVRRRGGR
jgi:hypothetical protein